MMQMITGVSSAREETTGLAVVIPDATFWIDLSADMLAVERRQEAGVVVVTADGGGAYPAGTGADVHGRHHHPRPTAPEGSIDTAIRAAVRHEVRAEMLAALADHRAQERERDDSKLVPLADAAARMGLTPKALRSRIERGSVPGAVRVGGRWHVAVSATNGASIR